MVQKIVHCLLILIVLAIPSVADFKDGLDAYDRGDYTAALKQWQPIAERGDPNAQYNLGLMFALGHGVAQDYPKAADWYRKAAEQGVAAAQYNLGVMFANGQGVAQNTEEATKWFLKAAEQGIDNAEINLADLYAEGAGASKNYAEAEKWYRKAAESGIASAAFNLGVMYDLGQGVTRDYNEAIKWYTKAAEAGYAPALTNLGILYYNAQGVKRDLVQAYAWLARAQKLGGPRAAELFRTTEARMKPKDVKAAQALVDQWHPTSKRAPEVEEAKLFKQPETAPAVPVSAQASADRAAPAPEKAPAPPATAESRPQDVWGPSVRIVAIGDVHGDYEQLVKALESAGLIDGAGDWAGGRAHVVQTGDVVDRGPDSRASMDLLMKLEKQAEEAGGGVHVLIGNHEAMDIYGDLRFVSPAEFAAFRNEHSETSQQAAYEEYRKAMTAAAKPEEDRSQWESQHPPGFVEHRAAFAGDGVYGRWIRSHNAAIKIGRTLFVHAGLGPKYADWSLDQINDAVRAELSDFSHLHGGVVIDEDGPLWYRGFAEGSEAELEAQVDKLLKHFDVDRIVVGHAYANGAITPRFHGKVLLVDVGLSRIYENTGKLGCLEIDEEHPYALHRGKKIELPKDEKGPDMLRYLKEAAALDPQPSPLAARIHQLEAARQAPKN